MLPKSSQSMDLSLDITTNNIEKPIEPISTKENQSKNNRILPDKKQNFKSNIKTEALLLSDSQDEFESLSKLPKQKTISNEKRKLEESISKAPSACQSVLKVIN
jgi:hypothetical protein